MHGHLTRGAVQLSLTIVKFLSCADNLVTIPFGCKGSSHMQAFALTSFVEFVHQSAIFQINNRI
jgi:hypothetical protein